MQSITIVTGNPGKVRELQAMAGGELDFAMRKLELDEIQSLNLEAIIKDKLQRAYAIVKGPVIVDDVSAGLKNLNGLPGPFIRFFNELIGPDSLYQLAGKQTGRVTIRCIAAYYDGKQMLLGKGEIKCDVVAPRGTNGFGFDCVVVPDGQSRTMAEMTEAEKMHVSHRGQAFRDLLSQLKQL